MLANWKIKIKDRVSSWTRSFVDFLKAPAGTREVLLGIIAAILVFCIFQFEYLRQQLTYTVRSANPQFEIPTTDPLTLPANTIYLPTIGVTAPIQYVESRSEAAIQEGLVHGVVHYADTALPGELGNAYIVGHSSDVPWSQGEYKTIFALLPKMRAGQRFYVTTESGELLSYKVLSTHVVNKNDFSVLDQHDNQERLMTLQTSYPLGTALKRFIVIAKMEE